jgi:hypothetical protein
MIKVHVFKIKKKGGERGKTTNLVANGRFQV